MKKILCAAFGVVMGAIGLAACDAASPPDTAVSQPVESEAIAAGEPSAAVARPVEFEEIATGEPSAAVARPVEFEEISGPEAIAAREALAAVMRDEDAFARARKLGALLPTLGPEAVPALRKTLEDPTLDLGATEMELLVRVWATYEPMEASRWAALSSPWNHRPAAVLSSFQLWAEADPQAVQMAIQRWGMQTPAVRDAMQLALVRGWFEANPSELERFMKGIGKGLERQRVVSTYVRCLIKTQGPDAVARWAESLPEDDATYKTTVYRQVGAALPLFDREFGLRWCEAHCDGPYGNNLRSIIARRWVLSDGAAALAWLSTMPEGHEKNLALRVAFAAWGQVNRKAALRWMAAQAPGEPAPWLRPMIPVYAKLLAQDSPLEAIKWAERIEADEEREIVLIRVARTWRKADEAAAEAWLLQSSLSEEAREKVRDPEPEHRPGF